MRTRTTIAITVAAVAALAAGAAAVTTPDAVAADSDDRVAAPPPLPEATGPSARPNPDEQPVNLVSLCRYSHAAADDPIVAPNEFGGSHLHVFFGNTSTNAASTYASMTGADTTCSRAADTAGYWFPAVVDGGEVVLPNVVQAYYTPAGKALDTVEAYPPDLRIVAGGEDAPDVVTQWGCHEPGSRQPVETSTQIPTCGSDQWLASRVFFPDCWDGVNTDSDDHASHMAYRVKGVCPETHPVALPLLRLTAFWPDADGGPDLALTSGDPSTLHADVWNTWDQTAFEARVEQCLVAGERCGVRGGPGVDPRR